MIAVWAVLARRVHLRPACQAPVRPELLVTLRPAGGLPMRVDPRVFGSGKMNQQTGLIQLTPTSHGSYAEQPGPTRRGQPR